MGLVIDGNVVHGLAIGGQSFKSLTTNSDGSITANNRKYFSMPKRITVSGAPSVSLPNWQNYSALSNGYGNGPTIADGTYTCVGVGKVDGTTYYYISGSILFKNGYSESNGCNIDIDESMPVGVPDYAANAQY